MSGLSRNRIAFLLRVSAQAVLTWIRDLAKDHDEKSEPTGRTIVLQLDAIWHYLREKRCKRWIWKALDRDTGQLLDWECGRRNKATLQQMVNRLSQWDVKMSCTDKWATYASIIPPDKLVQSKATTHDIERNYGRQRHWFGRFKRKSIIVSKSKEMVAYLPAADIVSRLPACRLSDDNQSVIMIRSQFSTPRFSLLAGIGAHASRSTPRSSTGLLF